MYRFRMIRGLLVAGVVLGFTHGFATLHRRHEARRWHELQEVCGRLGAPAPAPAPAPSPAPPPAPAPR